MKLHRFLATFLVVVTGLVLGLANAHAASATPKTEVAPTLNRFGPPLRSVSDVCTAAERLPQYAAMLKDKIGLTDCRGAASSGQLTLGPVVDLGGQETVHFGVIPGTDRIQAFKGSGCHPTYCRWLVYNGQRMLVQIGCGGQPIEIVHTPTARTQIVRVYITRYKIKYVPYSVPVVAPVTINATCSNVVIGNNNTVTSNNCNTYQIVMICSNGPVTITGPNAKDVTTAANNYRTQNCPAAAVPSAQKVKTGNLALLKFTKEDGVITTGKAPVKTFVIVVSAKNYPTLTVPVPNTGKSIMIKNHGNPVAYKLGTIVNLDEKAFGPNWSVLHKTIVIKAGLNKFGLVNTFTTPLTHVVVSKSWLNASGQDITSQRAGENVPLCYSLKNASGAVVTDQCFNVHPGQSVSVDIRVGAGWSMSACEDANYIASKNVTPANPATNVADVNFRCQSATFSGPGGSVNFMFVNKEKEVVTSTPAPTPTSTPAPAPTPAPSPTPAPAAPAPTPTPTPAAPAPQVVLAAHSCSVSPTTEKDGRLVRLALVFDTAPSSTQVIWGDGTTDSTLSHTYSSDGSWSVSVTLGFSSGSPTPCTATTTTTTKAPTPVPQPNPPSVPVVAGPNPPAAGTPGQPPTVTGPINPDGSRPGGVVDACPSGWVTDGTPTGCVPA